MDSVSSADLDVMLELWEQEMLLADLDRIEAALFQIWVEVADAGGFV